MMFTGVQSFHTCQVNSASRRIRLVLAARELLAVCVLCALIILA